MHKRLLTSALLLALLAACSSGPRHHDNGMAERMAAMRARAEAFAASGYRPAIDASLSLSVQQWVLKGETVSLNLAYPGSGKSLPLIVYQPGLGETAQAGMHWRSAWARAGYAVLSLQPLPDDAQAWSSDLARAADFKAMGRHHFEGGRIAQRLALIDAVLAEARQRAASGDSLWSRVDVANAAIAGFDLGAQTALAAADRFQAVLLLSPVTTGNAAAMKVPMLAVSSARDGDALGFMASAQARHALFEELPGANKLLLWFSDASHQQLAGNASVEAEEPMGQSHAGAGGGRSRSQGQGGGGGRRQGGGGGGQGGGMHDGGAMGPVGRVAPTLSAEAEPAVIATSLAFFDAHLRQQREAHNWLSQRAAPWLQGVAQWDQGQQR